MSAPRRYPDELRERALRLVEEAMVEDLSLSLDAAVKQIGQWVGIGPDPLRGWAPQRRIDTGHAPGIDAARVKELERENRGLRRATGILLAASSFFARGFDLRLPW